MRRTYSVRSRPKGYCVRCVGPTTDRDDEGTGPRHHFRGTPGWNGDSWGNPRSRSTTVATFRTHREVRMSLARTVRMFALVAAVALVGTACRADWSQWGGGTDRIGASRFESKISVDN